jgi:RNA polymerase sigma-70 factor (ECF subfamily)
MTSIDPSPDIHAAARGDRGAFDRLVVLYHARVYQFLRRRCPTAADAEDATQEAFLRAWTAINRFDPAGSASFTTWLFTLAARAAATHGRSRDADRRARERLQREAGFQSTDVHLQSPSADLWKLADQELKPEPRAMLWLRYAEDLTPAQIARVMQRSEVGVRVTLLRARRRLARAAIQSPFIDSTAEGQTLALALDSGPASEAPHA